MRATLLGLSAFAVGACVDPASPGVDATSSTAGDAEPSSSAGFETSSSAGGNSGSTSTAGSSDTGDASTATGDASTDTGSTSSDTGSTSSDTSHTSSDTGATTTGNDEPVDAPPCIPWELELPALLSGNAVWVDQGGQVLVGGGDGAVASIHGVDHEGNLEWSVSIDEDVLELPEATMEVRAIEPLPGGMVAVLVGRNAPGTYFDTSAVLSFDPSDSSVQWVRSIDLDVFDEPLAPAFAPIVYPVGGLATSAGGLLAMTGHVGWSGGASVTYALFMLDPDTGDTLVSETMGQAYYATLDVNADDTHGVMVTRGGSGVAADYVGYVLQYNENGEHIGGFEPQPTETPQRISGVGVRSDDSIVLASSGFPGLEATVARLAPDETLLGSAVLSFETVPAGRKLAVGEEDDAYVIARDSPAWILAATPDDQLSLLLTPEDGADITIRDIATGPLGRVVTSGVHTDPMTKVTQGYVMQVCD